MAPQLKLCQCLLLPLVSVLIVYISFAFKNIVVLGSCRLVYVDFFEQWFSLFKKKCSREKPITHMTFHQLEKALLDLLCCKLNEVSHDML